MKRQPKIDEMIAFLEARRPLSLEKIRNAHPAHLQILKKGDILGLTEDAQELKVRAEVCVQALEETIKACQEKIQEIKNRLKSTHQTQFWGQLAAAVGGAAVITTLAAKFTQLAFVGGGLSLLGSVIPILVQRQNKTFDKIKGLDEMFPMLVKYRLEAEQNKRELNFFINNGFNEDGISNVINQSNLLCSNIMELLNLT